MKFNMKQYMTLDGLVGYTVAMSGLIITVIVLLTASIYVQQHQSENFYSIDTNINSLKANGKNQGQYYKLKGE